MLGHSAAIKGGTWRKVKGMADAPLYKTAHRLGGHFETVLEAGTVWGNDTEMLSSRWHSHGGVGVFISCLCMCWFVAHTAFVEKRLFKRQIPKPHTFKGGWKLPWSRVTTRSRELPVAMILVIFSGWVHDRAGFHADLLEEIPHFLINVLLEKSKGHSYHGMTSPWKPFLGTQKRLLYHHSDQKLLECMDHKGLKDHQGHPFLKLSANLKS